MMHDIAQSMADEADDPEIDWQKTRGNALYAFIAIARDQELDDNALIRWGLLATYVVWTHSRITVDTAPIYERVSH